MPSHREGTGSLGGAHPCSFSSFEENTGPGMWDTFWYRTPTPVVRWAPGDCHQQAQACCQEAWGVLSALPMHSLLNAAHPSPG